MRFTPSCWALLLAWVTLGSVTRATAIATPSKAPANAVKASPPGVATLDVPLLNATQGIPKIVHFIFGLKGPDPPMRLENYLSVKSAHMNIKPDKIYFHYHWEPVGPWWNLTKTLVTLSRIPLPTEIYGNALDHFAHKSDVVRLQMLIKHGGIYLDLDVLALKSFDALLQNDFVSGSRRREYVSVTLLWRVDVVRR